MARKPVDRVDRYARLLMEATEGAAVSPRLGRMQQDIARHPGDCRSALARLAGLDGGLEDALVVGYLMFIEVSLLELRLSADHGGAAAAASLTGFQADLADLAERSGISGDLFHAVTMVLGRAGVDATPEVAAAMGRFAAEFADADDDAGVPPTIAAALDDVAALAAQDPFTVVDMLFETGHAMPLEAKVAMAETLAGRSDSAGAGLLLLLNPLPEVRRAAARALSAVAARLDGIALRRMITIRNWLPGKERGALDGVIRAARAAGVDCAGWPKGHLEAIHGSSLDGTGAQSFMLVARAGRERFLGAIMTQAGISDAHLAPRTKFELDTDLAFAQEEAGIAVLSRQFFDLAVRHHLHAGLAAGCPPPAGLLEVAEAIGASGWTPQAVDWRAQLEGMRRAVPRDAVAGDGLARILAQSELWAADDPLEQSWFEEGPHVERALAGRGRRVRAADHVLATVVEAARDKWAEHFTWVAMTHRSNAAAPVRWQNFAVLAGALVDGLPLAEIGLMRAIADRTADA